jgi:hypothetical protein
MNEEIMENVVVGDRMIVGFTTTCAIVSSNLDQGEVYNIM